MQMGGPPPTVKSTGPVMTHTALTISIEPADTVKNFERLASLVEETGKAQGHFIGHMFACRSRAMPWRRAPGPGPGRHEAAFHTGGGDFVMPRGGPVPRRYIAHA